MREDVKIFYMQAQSDVLACQILNSHYRKPFHIICFHAQQAVEKILKALILECNIEDKRFRTHDICFLLDILEKQYEISAELYVEGSFLTKCATCSRYDDVEKYSDVEANRAMLCSKKICAWAEEKIIALDSELVRENKLDMNDIV